MDHDNHNLSDSEYGGGLPGRPSSIRRKTAGFHLVK